MLLRPTAVALIFLSLPARTLALSASTSSSSSTASSPPKSSSVSPGNISVPRLQNGMDYVRLGGASDLVVSKVCMGTMTFGEQNTIDEGVEQLNLAFDEYGINFLDTAEMYPVPTKPETQGKTDEAVDKFLKNRNRDDVVLATKVAGRSDRITWLREDESAASLTRKQILESVDASLKRLGTDYIDLLQFHWPDRYTGGLFGQADFDPSKLYDSVPFEEQLSALDEVVKAGKVRYVGVSNETPYGICSFAELARSEPDLYPHIASVQNSYSLVCRKDYEAGMAEACHHHGVSLLAYSPLAGGVLTGKYRKKGGAGGRLTLFPGFMERYLGSQNEKAVGAYCDIASEHNMKPSELALSWCYHRHHVASTIIGATTLEQLEEDIKAYDIKLEEEVLDKIEGVYKMYTDPTKAY